MKIVFFFPGQVSVVFRKTPLGFLRQDPSEEARRIKDDPSMRDCSVPVKEATVRLRSLWCVSEEDQTEVLEEYILHSVYRD